MNFFSQLFNNMGEVVKNLLIINVLVFLADQVLERSMGIYLVEWLGLFYFDSPLFKPVQIVGYMFMHGGIWHLFFNMFSLLIFGNIIERVWGAKRFLMFYLICGLGAAALHTLMNGYDVYSEVGRITATMSELQMNNTINMVYRVPMVGASGAVYGIIIAFAMLFPNQVIYLNFLFPIKAKYMAMIMIAYDMFGAFQSYSGDNIAHFAHIGGALTGFILIKYWNHNNRESLF